MSFCQFLLPQAAGVQLFWSFLNSLFAACHLIFLSVPAAPALGAVELSYRSEFNIAERSKFGGKQKPKKDSFKAAVEDTVLG